MTPGGTYAEVGDWRIAFEKRGSGPVLLLAGSSFTNHETLLNDASAAMFFDSLARFSTLVRFDVLGVGGSDRPSADDSTPPLSDQILAVLDEAVGMEPATIMALLQGGPGAIEFAASHRNRVAGLILWNTTARILWDDGYDIGVDAESYDQITRYLVENWGSEAVVRFNTPSRMTDQRWLDWYVRYVRSTATPGQARANFEQARDDDVRELLAGIDVPTLVMARANYSGIPSSHGRYLAEHIPGAELVVVPGADGPLFWESPELILEHIERFLTGAVVTAHARPETLTLLFTDIVGSTEMAGERGDTGWSLLLTRHDAIAADLIDAWHGRLVKHMGDGVFAEFPSPSLALRAASAMRDEVKSLGVELRLGVHTAEVERRGDDLEGLGVAVARRVMEQASAGEIMVSRAVCDLLAGSRLHFEDAGSHRLKGLAEEWHLYRYDR